MEEPPLSEYEVVKFLSNRGGRCTNYELVSNFRGALNHPQYQAEARLKFKDIVNTVAIVGEYQNVKYIELKKECSLLQYGKPRQSEEFQTPSSLNNSFDGGSSYSSPLTQNFQPYWRYRLSTGSQVSSFKGSDTDLQSLPPHQSFHRSVSESTLPQDSRELKHRPVDDRQPSNNRVYRQHSISVPKEGGFQSAGDNFPVRRSGNFQPPRNEVYTNSLEDNFPIRKSGNFQSSRDEVFTSSSGRFLPENPTQNTSATSNSLPYYHSYSMDNSPTPKSYQDYRESDVGLPIVADDSRVQNLIPKRSHTPRKSSYERSHSIKVPQEDLETKKQRSFTFPDSVSIQNPQNRNIFSECSKNIPDYRGTPSHHVDNRFSSVIPCDSTTRAIPSNQRCVPASKIPGHISPKQSGTSVEYAVKRVEDHDILASPDYLRNVSKMCLEKSKTNYDSHSKNVPHKLEQIPKRSVDSSVHLSGQTDAHRVKISPREITNVSEDLSKTRSPEPAPPLPPERRRKSQDKVPSVTDESTHSCEIVNAMDGEVANKVRDRVQHFDQMEKQQRRRSFSSNKENKVYNNEKLIMEDDVSISVLDPKLKRGWFVKSAQCDYHGLVALLKKEPKLAALKDITSGYTALHWAAKHGDANVIKLIAGTYKVNPNIRSNGGYTPVHLAALYKHDIIGHLLVHTYGADPSLRDYDGKRADQYPQDYLRTMTGHKVSDRRPTKQRPLATKQTIGNSFMRIGSLNLRKARKSTVFASVRGNNRNRGSALDLKFGSEYTRKRISKKENLNTDQKRIEENKEDSDSAYGFSSKDSS